MAPAPDSRVPPVPVPPLIELPRDAPLRQYALLLRRGRWRIFWVTAAALGVGVLLILLRPPSFEAQSLVLVDARNRDGPVPIFDVSGTAASSRITNELEILRSRATAEEVARALLARGTPAGHTSGVFSALRLPRTDAPPDSLTLERAVRERLMDVVQFTPIRESDLIRITARSRDAEEAAFIANAFTRVYTARNLGASRQRSRAVREFIQTQVREKRTELDSAEILLQRYMRMSGVVSLDAEANRIVEQISRLEAERAGLEVDRQARRKNIASYQEEIALQEPGAARAIGESHDNYIRLLQEELARLEVQRDIVASQQPGAASERLYADRLAELDGRISPLRKRLREQTDAYLRSLPPGSGEAGGAAAPFLARLKQKIIEERIELGGIDARIAALSDVLAEQETRFDRLPRQTIELARLQRARLGSEKLYTLLDEKYNEAAIKEKSEFGYVDVVDSASVPLEPVSPNIPQTLVLSLLLGLGLGTGLVLVRGAVDLRIRAPEDLERFGLVPLTSIALVTDLHRFTAKGQTPGEGARRPDPRLILHHHPLSAVAESYRHLRIHLRFSGGAVPPRAVVVTSAHPREGKTTTVANLAVSYIQAEQRVLLIDADLRHPALHSLFGVANTAGLQEVLTGNAPLDDVLRRGVLPRLDLLTAGAPPANPSDLLGSDRMRRLFGAMKDRYEIVLCDSAPLLAVTDTANLATAADAVVLVASAGTSRGDALRRMTDFLSAIGVRVLGVALNRFDARKAGGAYHAGYHYGYYGAEAAAGKNGSGKHGPGRLLPRIRLRQTKGH